MKEVVYRELSDRLEYTLDDEFYLEELISIECPECGETTLRIVTTYELTHYVHINDGTNQEDYCTIYRGQDFIPDALLYVPYEGTSVISITEGMW